MQIGSLRETRVVLHRNKLLWKVDCYRIQDAPDPARETSLRSLQAMICLNRLKGCIWGTVCGGLLAVAVMPAAPQEQPVQRTNMTVEVKEADSGQPIANAHLTLQFKEPRQYRHSKSVAYTAKTNPQGRYKFQDIPKGTIRLIVTSQNHQSFGKDLELTKDNQVFEVKLKKPQPLL
jgi:hypothetical protein